MFEAIGRAMMLWLRNIPLLSALVLTVWLPGNIALNYAAARSSTELNATADFWLPSLIECIFGPISLGAVIFALDRRWQERQVGYFESMRAGFRSWGRLFLTMLVADLLIGLSCLLLILPGIILALRYALLGVVVVLEGRQGESARRRSTELMEGRMWGVFGIILALYVAIFFIVGGLYVPLDLVYETTSMTDIQYYGIAACLDCLMNVLEMSTLAVLFCVYAEASGRQPEPEVLDDMPYDYATPLPKDDGNPYLPPKTL